MIFPYYYTWHKHLTRRQLPSVFNVSTSQISPINLHECYFVCLWHCTLTTYYCSLIPYNVVIVDVHCTWYYFVLFRAKRFLIHGTKYKKGVAVHTGGDGLLPWFACIEKIVTVPAKTSTHVFFVLKEIQTLNYESHMHAYRVRVQNGAGITVLSQAELTTFRPLHVCTVIGGNGSKYICPKVDVDVYNEQI